MSLDQAQYQKKKQLVQCASKGYCRAPYLCLQSNSHNCSKCKQPIHVFCYGSNKEGGKKECSMCAIPNGISADAKIMKPPPPPTWFSQSDPSKSPKLPSKSSVSSTSSSKSSSTSTTLSSTSTSTSQRNKTKRKAIEKESPYNPNEGLWTLVNPNKTSASIWKHWLVFDKSEHPEMNAKVHCKYCPSILKIDKGTGGITKHTKSKHAEQLASTTSYKKEEFQLRLGL